MSDKIEGFETEFEMFTVFGYCDDKELIKRFIKEFSEIIILEYYTSKTDLKDIIRSYVIKTDEKKTVGYYESVFVHKSNTKEISIDEFDKTYLMTRSKYCFSDETECFKNTPTIEENIEEENTPPPLKEIEFSSSDKKILEALKIFSDMLIIDSFRAKNLLGHSYRIIKMNYSVDHNPRIRKDEKEFYNKIGYTLVNILYNTEKKKIPISYDKTRKILMKRYPEASEEILKSMCGSYSNFKKSILKMF